MPVRSSHAAGYRSAAKHGPLDKTMGEGVWTYENLQRHAHGADPSPSAEHRATKIFSQAIYAHRKKNWSPYTNPIPHDRAPDGYTHPLLRSCSLKPIGFTKQQASLNPLAFKNAMLRGRPASAGATKRSGAALLARAASCETPMSALKVNELSAAAGQKQRDYESKMGSSGKEETRRAARGSSSNSSQGAAAFHASPAQAPVSLCTPTPWGADEDATVAQASHPMMMGMHALQRPTEVSTPDDESRNPKTAGSCSEEVPMAAVPLSPHRSPTRWMRGSTDEFLRDVDTCSAAKGGSNAHGPSHAAHMQRVLPLPSAYPRASLLPPSQPHSQPHSPPADPDDLAPSAESRRTHRWELWLQADAVL